MARTTSYKFVGPPNTPQEVKRLRRENMDVCRRLGQPIIWRHMYNEQDVIDGLAEKCPVCYDDEYDQVRADCKACYGFGFVSVELNPDPLYFDQDGNIIESESPDPSWIPAPRYGGFDVPFLTWLIEPDVAVDVFRINKQGVMIQTYDAQGVAPWYPAMGDNDLCVNVALQADGFTIDAVLDRFQLKQVQNITLRGLGQRGQPRNAGNQLFMIAQSFQMSKEPTNTPLNNVPVDEPWY